MKIFLWFKFPKTIQCTSNLWIHVFIVLKWAELNFRNCLLSMWLCWWPGANWICNKCIWVSVLSLWPCIHHLSYYWHLHPHLKVIASSCLSYYSFLCGLPGSPVIILNDPHWGQPWWYRTTLYQQHPHLRYASWSGLQVTVHWDHPWIRTGPHHRSSLWPSVKQSTQRPGREYWAAPAQRRRLRKSPTLTGNHPQILTV